MFPPLDTERFAQFVFDDGPEPGFHFATVLPRRYRRVPLTDHPPAAHGPFLVLARFVDPDDPGVGADFAVAHLTREMDDGELAEAVLKAAGAAVLGRQERIDPACPGTLFLAEHSTADHVTRRYVRVVRSGRLLFWADGRGPRDAIETEPYPATSPVLTFQITNPAAPKPIESLSVHAGTLPRPYSFRYPVSWAADETERADGSRVVRLTTVRNDVECGELGVEVYPESTATSAAVLCGASDRWKERGLRLVGSLIVPLLPPPGFTAAHVYSPQASFEARPVALCAMLFEHPGGRVLTTALGPSPDVAPLAHAINRKAFQIVRESLTLG